jgi:hypothetical protein
MAPLLVFATLAGAWLAHTLEIWQLTTSGVHFSGPVSLSPFGGVHNYMVVVGVALLGLSAVFGSALWRLWWCLCRRLETARYHFRRLLRTSNSSHKPSIDEVVPSAPARLLYLWLPITAAQILLYVMQENIESAATVRSLPGISVLFGVHWAAPFIHGAVALVLAATIVLATRKIQSKAIAIEKIARAHVALWKWLTRATGQLTSFTISERIGGLAERLGTDLWQRPPPLPV